MIFEAQWLPRVIGLLLDELQKGPADIAVCPMLQMSSQKQSLVNERRLELLKAQIMSEWQDLNCCYELVIEPEIFWRLGGPPERRKGGSK